MTRTRTIFWTLALALVAATAACRDATGPGRTPGTAVISLRSSTADGAVLVRVTGPGFATPQAIASGDVLYWRQNSATEIVVAVFGVIAAGPTFRVDVPDAGRIGEYQATVVQVADRFDAERTDLTGYGASLAVAQ